MSDPIKLTYDYLDVPSGAIKLQYSVAPLPPLDKPPFKEPDNLTDGEWLKEGNYWYQENLLETIDNKLQLLVPPLIGPILPSGDFHGGGYGLQINVEQNIKITTCTINSNSTGNLTVQLVKFTSGQNPSQGTLVDSQVINITSTGVQDITLNLETNGPGLYWLGHQATFNLFRTDTLSTFPYVVSDVFTVINGRMYNATTTANRWYYYFNLHWEPLYSPYNISGYRISNPLNLDSFKSVNESNIKWDSSLPENTDLKIYVAITNTHATIPEDEDWEEADTNDLIPGIIQTQDLSGKFLWLKQVLSSTDKEITPSLNSVETDILVGESFNVQETLTIEDTNQLKPSIEYLNFNELINVSEDIQSKVSNLYFNSDEVIDLAEDIDSSTYRRVLDIEENLSIEDIQWFDSDKLISKNESITLSDSIDLSVYRKVLDINEELTISDSSRISNLQTISNISKIISYNPLIVVTNENPPKLFLIEITQEPGEEEETYTWTSITLTELSSLIDLKHNPYNEYLYSIDKNNLLKINDDDYEDRILIELDTDNDLTNLSLLDNRLKTFISTDSTTGELITFEEAEIKNINLDIRVLEQKILSTPLLISTAKGQRLPTDIRILKQNTTSLGLDIRILKYDFSDVSQHPIDYEDIDFKINGVSLIGLDDLDLSSVSITHNIEEEKSIATFRLHRRFDNLDMTLNGTASQITNQNTVQIYINGIKEFEGKISNINVQSESETVQLTATGARPNDKRNSTTIPFSSLNQNLHIYDCLLSNITIDNPYIDPTVDYEEENLTPEYYLGVKVDRGIRKRQQISRWIGMNSVLDEINNGTFQPDQNWSYFWYVKWRALKINSFGNPSWVSGNQYYIGTSLSPLSSEIIELQSAFNRTQRIYDDDITNLGYYYLGEAPYMEISCRNGIYETKDKWEDRADGLYIVKDEAYNYDPYVRKFASIEYQKLKNINDTILPITNCDVHLSLDAYYFYDIKLLKRLNFSNTTLSNIYNNLNGFPVSVKLINITFNDMKVNLQCSNQWSSIELKEFDEELPDEENYIEDERVRQEDYKYDVSTMARVF